MADEFVIVSGADSGYFPLLRDLVMSIRDKATAQRRRSASSIWSGGSAQRSWLGEKRAVRARLRSRLPSLAASRRHCCARRRSSGLSCGDYFPDMPAYLWID